MKLHAAADSKPKHTSSCFYMFIKGMVNMSLTLYFYVNIYIFAFLYLYIFVCYYLCYLSLINITAVNYCRKSCGNISEHWNTQTWWCWLAFGSCVAAEDGKGTTMAPPCPQPLELCSHSALTVNWSDRSQSTSMRCSPPAPPPPICIAVRPRGLQSGHSPQPPTQGLEWPCDTGHKLECQVNFLIRVISSPWLMYAILIYLLSYQSARVVCQVILINFNFHKCKKNHFSLLLLFLNLWIYAFIHLHIQQTFF